MKEQDRMAIEEAPHHLSIKVDAQRIGTGNKMARDRSGSEVVDPNAEVPATNADGSVAAPKAAKVKKEPTRGTLPDGYVTPVGLAKALTDQGLHTDKHGTVVPLKPQVVYSYIKNASKDAPFPMEQVTDSIGKIRDAVKLDAGIAWWAAKTARTAANKVAAAAKAEAKAAKAAATPAAASSAEVG